MRKAEQSWRDCEAKGFSSAHGPFLKMNKDDIGGSDVLCALRHFTGVLAETVVHSLRGGKGTKQAGETHTRGLEVKLQARGK